jgi:hypothetical protein
VVGRRDVPVLEVRLRAHLLFLFLFLFEIERIHIEFGVAVDEMLDDDSGPSIAEFSLKVLLDLHGTFQRSAGLVRYRRYCPPSRERGRSAGTVRRPGSNPSSHALPRISVNDAMTSPTGPFC